MSKPIVVIVCMARSSESWEPYQPPHSWHSRAGGGAFHSIMNGSRDLYLITSSARASTDDETSKPSRLRGLEIDSEIKLGRLVHREIAGLRPAKNLVDQLG